MVCNMIVCLLRQACGCFVGTQALVVDRSWASKNGEMGLSRGIYSVKGGCNADYIGHR